MYILFVLCVILADNLFAFAFLVSSQEAFFSLSRHFILSAMRVVWVHFCRVCTLDTIMYGNANNKVNCRVLEKIISSFGKQRAMKRHTMPAFRIME